LVSLKNQFVLMGVDIMRIQSKIGYFRDIQSFKSKYGCSVSRGEEKIRMVHYNNAIKPKVKGTAYLLEKVREFQEKLIEENISLFFLNYF
jgi:hypothetical protein